MNYLISFVLVAGANLVGGIPFGLLFVRWFAKIDVRTVGSGNIGATNVRRAAGTPIAIMVLCCDLLKGVFPVLLALTVMEQSSYGRWVVAVAGISAIVGHMYPVYLGFRASGKGVATALGVFLVLTPFAVLIALLFFILLVSATRRVSIGSMGGAAVLIPAVWMINNDPAVMGATLITVVLILFRHKENIKRLMAGQEPPLDKRH
jgi:glycerol-3-phosphate acyltransferase PlsY